MGACGALAVGAACLASVWAEGYAAGQQAVRHEDAARSLFRKALPDVRGSFNPVQMESILKNRIAGLRGGGKTTPHSRPSICCRTCTPPCRTPLTSASTA